MTLYQHHLRGRESPPKDRESEGGAADRGSRSVPDLDGQSTTDVGEMASRLFSKVSRKQNAPGVVS